ncbi:MAG: phosphoribosylglycinamide formyltransferase [Thermoplasmatota archaeon]
MALRVAVLASGRGSNLEHLLAAIRAGKVAARVELVVSDQPGAGALAVARRGGVPAIVEMPRLAGESAALYDARLLDVLEAASPDLVVLAGYLKIAGPKVCQAFRDRIVNIHPALLPSFKGLKAVQQALAAGARIAGCTTHLVTGEVDGGPILLQAAVVVRPDETEESLAARIVRLEHLLLPRTVALFAEGRVEVANGRATIRPGRSWLSEPGIELSSGALYGEGF